MSENKLRKLSDVDEKLTLADYVKIGQELAQLTSQKQEVMKNML